MKYWVKLFFMKKFWYYLPIAVILFIFDQIFKNWAYRRLSGKANFFILGRFFSLEFYQNPGIAFGIPLPAWLFFLLLCLILIVLGYFLREYYQKKDGIAFFALILILAGALSNIIDRFRFGYVIDYLNLAFWPVFNLADVMVVVGVIILLVKGMRKSNINSKFKVQS